MGSVTYDLQWKESMVELLDQLEVLDNHSGQVRSPSICVSDSGKSRINRSHKRGAPVAPDYGTRTGISRYR